MKAKLKDGWIPRWQKWWNRNNLHKVNGVMVPKEHPQPLHPPLATNHNRHRIRKMHREFERNQNADSLRDPGRQEIRQG